MEFHAVAHLLNLLQLGQRICFKQEIYSLSKLMLSRKLFLHHQAELNHNLMK